MSASSPSTRKQCDFTKLMLAGYQLDLNNGNTQDFFVSFHGPKETAYEGGIWRIHVTLPDDYPFASPSIGFVNKVLHPNIDESSGSVCLDVINQTWTPIYSLVNIFDMFLPQLLTYPNPSDPLNTDAASLLLKDKAKYEEKIKDHVRLHASKEMYQRSMEEFNLNNNEFSSTSSPTEASSLSSTCNGRSRHDDGPPSESQKVLQPQQHLVNNNLSVPKSPLSDVSLSDVVPEDDDLLDDE